MRGCDGAGPTGVMQQLMTAMQGLWIWSAGRIAVIIFEQAPFGMLESILENAETVARWRSVS